MEIIIYIYGAFVVGALIYILFLVKDSRMKKQRLDEVVKSVYLSQYYHKIGLLETAEIMDRPYKPLGKIYPKF